MEKLKEIFMRSSIAPIIIGVIIGLIIGVIIGLIAAGVIIFFRESNY